MSEPIVLLPGFMCDARQFMPQLVGLGPEFSFQIGRMTAGHSVEAIAADILLTAPEEFALIGHGLGGIVAQEVIKRAPGRVTRLALMDTNCMGELPAVAASRDVQIARVKAGKLAEVMREDILNGAIAAGPNKEDTLNIAVEMALTLGPEVFMNQARALTRRPDQQSTLRKIRKTPTLILCGEHDALYPPRRHEFMATLTTGSYYEIIPDAGHMPMLEQPGLINALIRQWMTL